MMKWDNRIGVDRNSLICILQNISIFDIYAINFWKRQTRQTDIDVWEELNLSIAKRLHEIEKFSCRENDRREQNTYSYIVHRTYLHLHLSTFSIRKSKLTFGVVVNRMSWTCLIRLVYVSLNSVSHISRSYFKRIEIDIYTLYSTD